LTKLAKQILKVKRLASERTERFDAVSMKETIKFATVIRIKRNLLRLLRICAAFYQYFNDLIPAKSVPNRPNCRTQTEILKRMTFNVGTNRCNP